ncbi:hypothetical protein MX659_02355 [Coriobacteriia bacterium Es71-Z0120]|uniref:hypothetical protein n=1 Tax=Parvivirga hydrogeniphila TaxID=2939460 RepID=UPI002260E0ED|nr:hypothetical protein [Parvivirga hydrogeniphila]MCL4078446.1 hypothetical protein [Parvivirga hydrogeniphila]
MIMRRAHTRSRSVLAFATTAALVAAVLGTGTAASAPQPKKPDAVTDSETVYAICDARGKVSKAVVVDWLHLTGDGLLEVADPAPGARALASLTDGFEPRLEGGFVRGSVESTGAADVFYRVQTGSELPLEISARYELDGVETEPDQLAGKSGRLAITLTFHNRLERRETVWYTDGSGSQRSEEVTYAVPLLCVPQFKIDGTRMTVVEAPEQAQVAVTGSTSTYAVPVMPSPDASMTLVLDARDIRLEPLIISVFPKLPASPDFSVASQLGDVADALDQLAQLSDGQRQVVTGILDGMSGFDTSAITGAASGLDAMRTGLAQLADGANGVEALAAAQTQYLDGVIAGIDTGAFDDLAQLQAALQQLAQGVSQAQDGAEQIVALIDGQIALLDQIRTSNASLLALAQDRAAAYPTDPQIAALAQGLAQQQALLDALRSGGVVGGQPIPGLADTRAAVHDLANGLKQTEDGLAAIVEQAGALEQLPQAFLQLKAALVVLRDGGEVAGQQMPGLATTRDSARALADGIGQVSDELASSADSLSELADAASLLDQLRSALSALASGGQVEGHDLPGLDTSQHGLKTLSDGLRDGVNDINRGEAITEAMKRAADGYRSFLGLPEGATGRLTIMYRLEGVGAE